MEAMLTIPLTVPQLADLIRQQLPREEQLRLASLIQVSDQADEYVSPTKQEILADLKQAYLELKRGTLKTRPAAEFLNEL